MTKGKSYFLWSLVMFAIVIIYSSNKIYPLISGFIENYGFQPNKDELWLLSISMSMIFIGLPISCSSLVIVIYKWFFLSDDKDFVYYILHYICITMILTFGVALFLYSIATFGDITKSRECSINTSSVFNAKTILTASNWENFVR